MTKRFSAPARFIVAVVLAICGATAFAVVPARAQTQPVQWSTGDIFVGIGNPYGTLTSNPGVYQVLDSTGQPKDTIVDGTGGFATGCAADPFNTNGFLWTTGTDLDIATGESGLTRFALSGAHTSTWFDLRGLTGIPGSTGGPESAVFDRLGHVFVGTMAGTNVLLEYATDTTDGVPLAIFSPPVGTSGVDDIDLAVDGSTIYYTSEDANLYRFDVTGTGQALPTITLTNSDGSAKPEGYYAYWVRILPPGDGSGGFLIASNYGVEQYGAEDAGTSRLVRQFGTPGLTFSLDMTPDGKNFWTATYSTVDGTLPLPNGTPSVLQKWHIPTGQLVADIPAAQLGGPTTTTPDSIWGMCVLREYTAGATQPTQTECTATGSTVDQSLCHPLPVCDPSHPDLTNPDCQNPLQPVITYPTPQTTFSNTENDTISPSIVLQAHDPQGRPLTFSVSRLPRGLTLTNNPSGTSATITGTLDWEAFEYWPGGFIYDANNVVIGYGPAAVDVTVTNTSLTNPHGQSTTITIPWTVVPKNAPPSLRNVVQPAPNTLKVPHGVPLDTWLTDNLHIPLLTYAAVDPDLCQLLSFSAPGLPAGLTAVTDPLPPGSNHCVEHVERIGHISGTPTGPDAVYSYDIVVSDNVAQNSPQFPGGPLDGQAGTFTIELTNIVPTSSNLVATTREPGVAIVANDIVISAFDGNNDIMTFTAAGLPPGLSLGAPVQAAGSPNGSVSIVGTPTTSGTFLVTVTIWDGRFLSDGVTHATAASTITITVPNRPPTWSAPLNQTQQPGVAFSLPAVTHDPNLDTITYATGGTLPAGVSLNTLNPAGPSVDGTLYTEGSYGIPLTASDGFNPLVPYTFTISVPNIAPVVAGPASQTLQPGQLVTLTAVSATDANLDTLTYTLMTGLPPGLSFNTTTHVISGTPTTATAGAFTVTVKVDDGHTLGAVNWTFTLTVPNAAPVVIAPVSQNYTPNVPFTLPIVATDANQDTLTYTVVGSLPPGVTLLGPAAPGGPAIAGTITTATIYTVAFNVSDGTATTPWSFTLTPTNVPPVVTAPLDQTVQPGSAFSLPIVATDLNHDPLAYAATSLPSGVTLNAAGPSIDGTLYASGVYSISFTVSDGVNQPVPYTFKLTVPNIAPVIVTSPASQSIPTGTPVSLTTTATDANHDTLTFSLTGTLPAGLTFDTSTGTISGTPTTPGTSPLLTIVASDGHGGTASSPSFTLTVPNAPPVFTTVPPSQTIQPGQPITALAVAANDVNNDTMSFSQIGLPAGLTLGTPVQAPGSPTATLAITGTASVAAASYPVTLTVLDGRGGSATAGFTLTVPNVAPVFTAVPANPTLQPGLAVSGLSVTATDANNDTLTYTAVTALPGSLVLNPSTGAITGTAPTASGPYPVTVQVSDGHGGTTSTTFSVTVANVAPVFNTLPSPSTRPGQAITPFAISATDANLDALTYAASGFPTGITFDSATHTFSGTPTTAGSFTVAVTADDGHGGTTQRTFIWTVPANNPPVFVAPATTQTSIVNVPITPYSVKATDPDAGDVVTYSATGLPPILVVNSSTGLITGTPTLGGTYTVTITARDQWGASTTETFTWNITTNRPPDCSVAVANPAILWPPNHKFVPIAIRGVVDPDGNLVTVTVTRVLQDEPTLVDGSGATQIDAVISASGVASVRAERSGLGDGRIYQLFFTADDGNGGTCSGSVTVGVPHDKKDTPIDSVVRYDSTVAGGPALSGPEFNVPPDYSEVRARATAANTLVTLPTRATDLNGDTLTFSASGLPPGLSINAQTGVVTGQPTLAGTYPVTLTVSDPYGGVDTTVFTWTITTSQPHADGDGCAHERTRGLRRWLSGGHRDGDGCDHDRQVRGDHHEGDGCDHDRRAHGHKANDGCDHERG